MSWFDSCILLSGCLVEVFLIYDYFHNFFELRRGRRVTYLVIAAASLILFVGNSAENSYLNLLLFPTLMWLVVSFLFESSVGVRIGYFVTAYVVMIGVEFLHVISSQTTAEMLNYIGAVPVSDYGLRSIGLKFLNFLIFLVLKQTSGQSHSRMTNRLFFAYLCVPITSLGIMITVYYSGVDFGGHAVIRMLMALLFFFLILGNMALFYAFQKHTEGISEAAEQEAELLYKNAEIERLMKMAELNESYHETVHNMTHSMKVIEHLAREGDAEGIFDVIQELTGRLTQRRQYEYSGSRLLNTVLYEYVTLSQKRGVQFDLYVEPGCPMVDVKDIDFVAMVGNMLDNAFDYPDIHFLAS